MAVLSDYVTASLDETLGLITDHPDLVTKDFWIEKIASERHGLVPAEAEMSPMAYYLLNTRNVGGYLYEWYDRLAKITRRDPEGKKKPKEVEYVAEGAAPKLSYSYAVRNIAGGYYGVWATTATGNIIHRDITDTYTSWNTISLPSTALDVATDGSGHNAVALCTDSVLFILRARGKVVQGPLALGVGPIVEARITSDPADPNDLTIRVLASDGTIYVLYDDGTKAGQSKGHQQFTQARGDLNTTMTLLAEVAYDSLLEQDADYILHTALTIGDYRGVEAGESPGFASGHRDALSFVHIALGALEAKDEALVADLGQTVAPPTREVQSDPYSARFSATRTGASPSVSGGPIMYSPDDVRDALTEMEQNIVDEGDRYEDATGDDYQPDWGVG